MSSPELRIVRGDPTDEELAALTALIAAAGSESTTSAATSAPRGRWNDPALGVRRPWAVGPGGWRAAR